MKFEQNCTILAVAARQRRQTQRKCAHVFEILVFIDAPSFASNDALRRRPGVVPGFRHVRGTLNFEIFQLFAFFEGLTGNYSKISLGVGFSMEKGLVFTRDALVFVRHHRAKAPRRNRTPY